MPGRHIYEWTLIRVVPRVERGECLNVGALLYCRRATFLEMRVHLNPVRLAAFAPQLDQAELARYLQAWGKVCAGASDGGPIARLGQAERFRWLSATKSTILQCSPVHTGLTDDPAAVLDHLLEAYVRG